MSRPNKHRLKGSPTEYETVDKVCIGCGHRKPSQIATGLPRPNTTAPITRSSIRPGSNLGCFLGNHDYYYEYELATNEAA
jgi:hypothetical protein